MLFIFPSLKFEVTNFFSCTKNFYQSIFWAHFFLFEVGNFIAQNFRWSVFQNTKKIKLIMPIFVIIWSCFWILEVSNLKLPTFFYEKKDSINKLSGHIFLIQKLATSFLKILHLPFFKIQGQKWAKYAHFRQKFVRFLNFRSFKFEVINFFLWKNDFIMELSGHIFCSRSCKLPNFTFGHKTKEKMQFLWRLWNNCFFFSFEN